MTLPKSIDFYARFFSNSLNILTDETAHANEQRNKEVARWCQHTRSQQFQFTVESGESGRTQAFVLFRRVEVTAASAILAREPLAFVLVNALAAGHFESGWATVYAFQVFREKDQSDERGVLVVVVFVFTCLFCVGDIGKGLVEAAV